MRDNVITATYNGTGRYKTQPLYQYDYGQLLKINGVELPSAYEVHFSNAIHGNATTQIGNADGVSIPDMYLLSGQTVYAWLFLHSGADDGETEFIITIPVLPRAKPTDQQPTPVQQSAIDEAILALQQALYEAGVTVSHYPQVQNGYWYTWDVENGEWVNTGVQAQGEQGNPGADGYTPTISVTDITGGHRLTITNKSGTTTVDVMNGTDGQDGEDGYSPSIDVSNITGGHRVTVTDKNGTETFDVMNGTNGTNGISPTASVSKSGGTATITITDANGTTTAQVSDGTNGTNGTDGYSPTATVSKSGDTATITITDKNGTTTATVTDGTDGQDGAPGVGVPSGGTDGQMLVKDGATDYATKWANQPTIPVTDVQVNGTSVLNNGVANVPIADGNTLGAVKCGDGTAYGVRILNQQLIIRPAYDTEVKNGTQEYRPITPYFQHQSVFYGLAKCAGDTSQSSSSNAVGTYTETALSKIYEMLNKPVTVSGSTPSITAKAGIKYVCGEVSTLTITTPSSGCIDVRFTSGSTATVLTVTPPTGMTMHWPDWFDPTALEANTIYEINIDDGIYGAVMTWSA